MLTIAPGHSTSYLTDEVAKGRESYYTGAVAAGEPPGRWYGTGAAQLGLTGLVDADDMRKVYELNLDPRDPGFRTDNLEQVGTLGRRGQLYRSASDRYAELIGKEPDAGPERRAELRADAERATLRHVSFYDATFSVQKSVTVLHAAFEAQEVQARARGDETAAEAWQAHRLAVEEAIWAGWQAGVDYLAEQAGYSRTGHHGGAGGRWLDSHDLTVAGFFQHDSRDHDPHLHIHGAILNKVQGPDGTWRALDGRSLYLHRPAAAAVAERVTEEHTSTAIPWVQFAMRPDGKAREIVGMPVEAMNLFSSRRRAIGPKAAELVDRFRARFGRQPSSLELDRLSRQAWAVTRRAKEHTGESAEDRFERWDEQLRGEVAGGLAAVANNILAADLPPRSAEPFDERAVLETAAADVQSTKAAWTRADYARAVNAALPDHLGGLDKEQVTQLVDRLTGKGIDQLGVTLGTEDPGEDTLPAQLRLANGQTSYRRPGAALYATAGHLAAERQLQQAATAGGAARVSRDSAQAFIDGLGEQGVELGADQQAAVRGVLTSGRPVESIVGPAGTGKSFVVGTINLAWQDPALWGGHERRVYGLAASQIATDVLAQEGVTSRNVTRWLDSQQRLSEGRPAADDHAFSLHAGDLVVVDESAMADTGSLVRIHRTVADAGGKLLLVGDHRQLSAVGSAGGMDLAVDAGQSYELTEARRFEQAWERDASLRLRDGDVTALQDYRRHGRVVDAGTVEEAEQSAARAWLADHLDGRQSLLIVPTNEQANRLSAQIRAQLVRFGHVEEQGVPLVSGNTAGVGDLVQARHNGWELGGWEGNRRGPINRETYRVTDLRADGGLVVDNQGERMTLPGRYVSHHVALGYASTVHSAQGRTVDTGHMVATEHSGSADLYVAMSRGRASNTAHVVTVDVPADNPPGLAGSVPKRDPAAVLAHAMQRDELPRSATVERDEAARDTGSFRFAAERFAAVADEASQDRTRSWLDELASSGAITAHDRQRLAADKGTPMLARMLRQAEVAGHNPRRVLGEAARERGLDDARSVAGVLRARIQQRTDLTPKGDRYADWVPATNDRAMRGHLQELARVADQRLAFAGTDATEQRPGWVGNLPQREAGTVAATRELATHEHPDRDLPGPPKPDRVEAYALWRASWRALGRPEETRAETEMSTGLLRMRVRAYGREKTWAPDWVAHEMAGTNLAAQRARTEAAMREQAATVAADRELSARLQRQADGRAARADVLRQRATDLELADSARAQWFVHTAETRQAAGRATVELSKRGVDPHRLDRSTTAEQWLVEHERDQRRQDQRRRLDELEVASAQDAGLDQAQRRDQHKREPGADQVEYGQGRNREQQQHEQPVGHIHQDSRSGPESTPAVEVDIRQRTEREPVRSPRQEQNWQRVPSAKETAVSVERAHTALREMRNRQVSDGQPGRAVSHDQQPDRSPYAREPQRHAASDGPDRQSPPERTMHD